MAEEGVKEGGEVVEVDGDDLRVEKWKEWLLLVVGVVEGSSNCVYCRIGLEGASVRDWYGDGERDFAGGSLTSPLDRVRGAERLLALLLVWAFCCSLLASGEGRVGASAPLRLGM